MLEKEKWSSKSKKCTLALQVDHIVKWCVDSGCSKHMTGIKHNFVTLDEGKEGTINFENE